MLRPDEGTFAKYLPYFLQDLPNPDCAKAGRPAYSSGIKYSTLPNGSLTIEASHFMSYHTSLRKSVDFYSSLKQARVIADDIQANLRQKGHDITLFPYRYELFIISIYLMSSVLIYTLTLNFTLFLSLSSI